LRKGGEKTAASLKSPFVKGGFRGNAVHLRTERKYEFIAFVILREPEETEESLNTRCFASLSLTSRQCKVDATHHFIRKEP
jgi:hypothetical protein